MASLLDCDPAEVEADPLAAGRACAIRYDALVLVKGCRVTQSSPDGTSWKYAAAAPVWACRLGRRPRDRRRPCARGAAPLTALLWAVWLHGEAGSALSTKVGPLGFLARELPAEIPALLAR